MKIACPDPVRRGRRTRVSLRGAWSAAASGGRRGTASIVRAGKRATGYDREPYREGRNRSDCWRAGLRQGLRRGGRIHHREKRDPLCSHLMPRVEALILAQHRTAHGCARRSIGEVEHEDECPTVSLDRLQLRRSRRVQQGRGGTCAGGELRLACLELALAGRFQALVWRGRCTAGCTAGYSSRRM